MTTETGFENRINTRSRSSDLRITDLRVAKLEGVPMRHTIIRIDTNQGISGWGEARDQSSVNYVLMLKSRLLGENPCNIEKVFRKIRQFGGPGRQGGGVSGVEMALLDLAGKAYDVPAWLLAGGKYRDRILVYADTEEQRDPEAMGAKLLAREQQGFKMLKMDIGLSMLWDVPGAVIAPPRERTRRPKDLPFTMHPFTGTHITKIGVDHIADYVRRVRDVVGYELPIAADHFGYMDVDSCIRLARALEPYALEWLEDLIPWQFTQQWRQLTESIATPTCTGEDIYLAEGFKPLLDAQAIRIAHPDPASAGGIMETKRIGDLAQPYGIPMALHLAATPIATMASVAIGASTENFLALEFHAADVGDWASLVTGLPETIIEDGYITVPDGPGLGFEGINEEAFRARLDASDPLFFSETAHWDSEWSYDRPWG
ncbi:mandelate racemase/muconate lactonizing enzyme family protein [Modestobacter sp. VKM Ac-2986]|uniref:mandelate racemase/muconate lactonizing enzyme family protein n=1 Tax=Modestobacter sp. VKM Ac-2986 TaxID=3004140 RepID=UPI0022AAB725|nr:mandelate racemase/muconate lactonizing enzyme family protein [Modestobacter sp. VKM Ac-2986]MCZ2827730.1 mandelate racemase/muconate lactonizing enzyme family protein [Modestobacter sp. VKM Ac-2986]